MIGRLLVASQQQLVALLPRASSPHPVQVLVLLVALQERSSPLLQQAASLSVFLTAAGLMLSPRCWL